MKFPGTDDVVNLRFGKYANNGNLALSLVTPSGELYARLSVNIESPYPLPDDYCYLDTNNIPCVEQFVKDNNIGVFCGAYGESGWCKYPLYKIYLHNGGCL